eukprot:763088-Hanusia_phi.AAC.10
MGGITEQEQIHGNVSGEKPLIKDDGSSKGYDWALSTAENYSHHEMEFVGPFADIRQRLQDRLIEEVLDKPSTTQLRHPWIIFTCGAMGSGKSYVIDKICQSPAFHIRDVSDSGVLE